jgi:hypothetical protein
VDKQQPALPLVVGLAGHPDNDYKVIRMSTR